MIEKESIENLYETNIGGFQIISNIWNGQIIW